MHDAARLDTLQNRAGRLVTGAMFRTSTDSLLQDLGWDELTVRRQIHKLTTYHRFTNPRHQTPNYIRAIMPETRAEGTGRTSRNSNTHTMPPNRTTSYQNSFFLSTGKYWNQLPESTRSLPPHSLKREMSKRLGVPGPPAYYKIGTKMGNILHTRLRMAMSLINSHSFQIQKHGTPACSCGFKTENDKHFILTCPNYNSQIQHRET